MPFRNEATGIDPGRYLESRTSDYAISAGENSAAFTASGSIASGSLLTNEIEKQVHCFLFPLKMMVHALTALADASPTASETGLSEQRRLDRHGIVPCHVFRWIHSLDVEMVGLGKHDVIFADWPANVQQQL